MNATTQSPPMDLAALGHQPLPAIITACRDLLEDMTFPTVQALARRRAARWPGISRSISPRRSRTPRGCCR